MQCKLIVQNSNQQGHYRQSTKLVDQIFTLGDSKMLCGEIHKEQCVTHSEDLLAVTEAVKQQKPQSSRNTIKQSHETKRMKVERRAISKCSGGKGSRNREAKTRQHCHTGMVYCQSCYLPACWDRFPQAYCSLARVCTCPYFQASVQPPRRLGDVYFFMSQKV